MAPPALQVRRQRRSGRARRAGRGESLVERVRVNVKLGSDLSITPGMLSRAPNRPFRPTTMTFEGLGAYVPLPANGSDVAGGAVPCAVQLDMCDPSGNYVATSRPRVMGVNPVTVSVQYPSSGDWFQPTPAANQKLAVVSAICLGATAYSGVDAWVRGILAIGVRYGPEVLPNSCPANYPEYYSGSGPSNGEAHLWSSLDLLDPHI